MAKAPKPRSQKVSKAKGKSPTEYTIHEVLPMFGYEETDEGRHCLFAYLHLHNVTWRTIDTLHGPAHYFDKEVMNELKKAMEVNEARRRVAAENRAIARHIINRMNGLQEHDASCLPGETQTSFEEE